MFCSILLAQAPKTIKIYTNRQTLGFDDADSVKETQTIELEPKDFEEDAVINLRFVKFQNINSLVVNNSTFFLIMIDIYIYIIILSNSFRFILAICSR